MIVIRRTYRHWAGRGLTRLDCSDACPPRYLPTRLLRQVVVYFSRSCGTSTSPLPADHQEAKRLLAFFHPDTARHEHRHLSRLYASLDLKRDLEVPGFPPNR